MTPRTLVAAALLAGGLGGGRAPAALAQEGPAACPAPADARAPGTAVVVVRASAHADSVRFERTPQISVRADDCAGVDPVRMLERRNLPDPVRPGVTYRDVSVAVEIRGHLRVLCLEPVRPAADSAATAVLLPVCGPGADSTAPPRPRR